MQALFQVFSVSCAIFQERCDIVMGLFLSGEEKAQQLETISAFLAKIHPVLLEESNWKPSIELRPIVRNRDKIDIKLKKSLNLWKIDDESRKYLTQFLNTMNGQQVCLYYSVFCFDNKKTAETNITKRGKITSEAVLFTQEIVLDFDDISFEDYTELVDLFESLDIFALWVYTGHGYQAHILLDVPCYDTQILRKAVAKFRSKGFACDPKCIDPARVMRLPWTFNCKGFVDDKYAHEQENPPRCEVMQDTESRYSIEEIFEKLDTLPTISPDDEAEFIEACKDKRAIDDDSDDVVVEDVLFVYPYLDRFNLPDAMKKMLRYTRQGYRNKVLGFLIKQFKVQYKLGKDAILEILEIWGQKACDPPYDRDELYSDFKRLFYHYNGLSYDASLKQEFGTIDFDDLIVLRKKDIYIPNKFFRSFPDLTDKEIKVYLAILLLEHNEQDATQETLANLLQVSDRSIRTALQPLLKSGHAYKVSGNRKMGIPFTYHTSKIVSKNDGYQTYSYNDLQAYVNELCNTGKSNGELKLFMFMRYKFYSGDIFMTQENLGINIGCSRRSVSDLVASLEEKRFLRVKKTRKFGFREVCEYTLLR